MFRFPELAGLSAALAPHRLVVDGEVVAFDKQGRPSFGQLQHRMHLARPADVARVAATIPVTYATYRSDGPAGGPRWQGGLLEMVPL